MTPLSRHRERLIGLAAVAGFILLPFPFENSSYAYVVRILGGFRDRALELFAPHRRGLPGPRVDQIERVTLERRTGDRDGVAPVALPDHGAVHHRGL